jgi:Mn2+/Fe2+ NRAMP family transporter
LLAPLLGLAIAPTLFGIALLCCGLNSTVTATMAGQIVMEGSTSVLECSVLKASKGGECFQKLKD